MSKVWPVSHSVIAFGFIEDIYISEVGYMLSRKICLVDKGAKLFWG